MGTHCHMSIHYITRAGPSQQQANTLDAPPADTAERTVARSSLSMVMDVYAFELVIPFIHLEQMAASEILLTASRYVCALVEPAHIQTTASMPSHEGY